MNQEKNIKLRLAARTHTGLVRELNEDNFIATKDISSENWIVPQESYINNSSGTVIVVTDGMGGANAGEVASRITVDSIKNYFRSLNESLNTSSIKKHLVNSTLSAHKNIIAHSIDNSETEGMGATVVIAAIIEAKVFYSWSGDSRCYLFSKGKLKQLTKDHSYVQSLVDKGKITKEQAFLHPESNIITQNLGDKERLPEPEFGSSNLTNGDFLVLCSDGLNSMITDEEMESIINVNANNLNNCIDKLIESANNAGGNDNITIVLAGVGEIENNKVIIKDKLHDSSQRTDTIITHNGSASSKKKALMIISIGIILLTILFAFFKPRRSEKNIEPSLNNNTDTVKNEDKPEAIESEQKKIGTKKIQESVNVDDKLIKQVIDKNIKEKNKNQKDSSLTPIIKEVIEEKHSNDIQQLKNNTNQEIKNIPATSDTLQVDSVKHQHNE